MPLQQAIDLAHVIRESFPHVCPHLTETARTFRDDSQVYILGVYRGYDGPSWVLSSAWDYEEFLKLFRIFC